ncbi:MAG: enoyl-CoA hydratase-related protein [Candidatus Hydrogenedentes bacterium]|jgi:enoyl-CoA hydratase/carnithine racemase|nr:enoyl-CoA hydratase-related protein [Candidatus Hydrogenedentota bacterium]
MESAEDSPILIRKEPPLGWMIINRSEKMNAFTSAMWESVPGLLDSLENDSEVRVIVVRGAGERAFSAGADIHEFKDQRAARKESAVNTGATGAAFQAFENRGKPTVSMIRGICMGGGCAVALSTDIRVASSDSIFAITPARLGLAYPYGGIERAVSELGAAHARYLFLTAKRIGAEQALAMGIIHEMYEPEDFEEAAKTTALTVAENAPKTLRSIQESVRQAILPPEERDLKVLQRLARECFASKDYQEGLRAFAEKRKPRFQDR